MLPLKLAVASWCFDLPLVAAVKAAAACRATGIQFDVRQQLRPEDWTESARKQFLHSLDEVGLQVASLHIPTRRTLYDQDRLDDRLAAFRKFLEFAWRMRTQIVTARIGRIPADAESPEYRLLVEVLNDLARHSNHVGAALAIQPSGDRADALEQLLSQVTAGPIGVDFDPAACVMSGEDPTAALRTLHRRVLHTRARDGLRDVDGSGVETPLGRGEVDWLEFIALLHEIPYTGWVTITRTQGDDRVGDVERAAAYLRELSPV